VHTHKSTYLELFPSLLNSFYVLAVGSVVDKSFLFIGRFFRYRAGTSIRTQNYGIEMIDTAIEQVQTTRRTVQDMTTCTMWYLLL
jgi:hypothetical protein